MDMLKRLESLGERTDKIYSAFREQFRKRKELAAEPEGWIHEIYDDYVIIREGEKYFRANYSETEEGEVSFAGRDEWVEMEKVFQVVGKAFKTLRSHQDDPEGSLRVGNYLALWGGRDLEGVASGHKNQDGSIGEFFTKSTDFSSPYLDAGVVAVDFEHGQQPDGTGPGADDILGFVDAKSLKTDDVGLWAERVLLRRNKYQDFIADLVEAGMIGSSSEAVNDGVEKSANGQITRWPLKRDSLTVMPMEPRMMTVNTVQALKALSEKWPELKGRLPEDAESVGTDEGEAEETTAENNGSALVFETISEGDNTMSKTMEELTEQLEGQDEKIDALSKNINNLLERMQEIPALRDGGYYSDAGGEHDQQAKSFGDWLLAVKRHDIKRLTTVYKSLPEKALNEASGEAGGYLVPEDNVNELIGLTKQQSVVRQRATVIPVASPAGSFPALDLKTAPTAGVGNSALGSGVVSSWEGESADLDETNIKLDQIKWRVAKLGGYTEVSNEINEDSPFAIEALIKVLFSNAIAAKEDYAFIRGTGVGMPLGMLNAPCAVGIAPDTDNSFDKDDAAEMFSRFKPMVGLEPIWLMHRGMIPDLSAGFTATSGKDLIQPREVFNQPIFGYDIVFSEHLPQDDNSGCVILADLKSYVIFDRRQLSIAYSEHAAFKSDEGVWRFTERLDAKPWLNGAMTLGDPQGGFTVSPFVYLND